MSLNMRFGLPSLFTDYFHFISSSDLQMNFRCDTATYWAWVGTSVLDNDSREDDDDGFDDDDTDTLMSFLWTFLPRF